MVVNIRDVRIEPDHSLAEFAYLPGWCPALMGRWVNENKRRSAYKAELFRPLAEYGLPAFRARTSLTTTFITLSSR